MNNVITMKVHYGTKCAQSSEINLNEYGESNFNMDENWLKGYNLLCELMNDVAFADNGHRNHDAVNGCIALHVMGYDADEWFNNWCNAQLHEESFFRRDLFTFMDHVNRVVPYLEKWGPAGHREDALNYII